MKHNKFHSLIFCLTIILTAFSQAFAGYAGEILDYVAPQNVNWGEPLAVTATVKNTGTLFWVTFFLALKLEYEFTDPVHVVSWETRCNFNQYDLGTLYPDETRTLSCSFTKWDSDVWETDIPGNGVFNCYIRLGIKYSTPAYDITEILDEVVFTLYVGDVMTTTIESTTTSTISPSTTSTIPINGSTTTIEDESSTTTTINDETTTSMAVCPSEIIYGEYSEETEHLRYFRDNVLSQTPTGQEIIKLYYEWSPIIIKAIKEDEEFMKQVKEMIDGVLEMVGEVR